MSKVNAEIKINNHKIKNIGILNNEILKVKTKEEAILGASYIIAEWVSDNAYYRKSTRNYIYNNIINIISYFSISIL